ncbi:MAG TPA: DUF4124 domain-containing protein [Pseudomonadales bacterium]|jgi:hypothetical protein
MISNKTVLLCVLACCFSPSALAGIYKCVSPEGKASYSQTPCPDSAIEGNTQAHQLWRTLRGLVVEGKVFSTSLKGDVESIQQCQAASAAYVARVDLLAKDAQAVALHHPHLYRAFELLHECGRCRFAALSYCEKADVELNDAMNTLH